jgi:hypothetical protein
LVCGKPGAARQGRNARLLATVAEADERGMTLPCQSVNRQTTNITNKEYIMIDPATFVLVHGAWFGGWCWKKVTRL